MQALAPQWLEGCRLRGCWFEPTFHKHKGELCHGVQIHTEGPAYDHQTFSSRGASRRSPSRRSAVCIRTTRYGAISPTSTSAAGSLSMSSTVARCSGNGSTIRRRQRRTWIGWRCQMSRAGRTSASHTCVTESRRGSLGVIAGLVPAIHVFLLNSQRRGCPRQARA